MVEQEKKSTTTLKKLCSRWFIDAFGGMSLGLFATLIAGTILTQIATLIGVTTVVGGLLNQVATCAKVLMGAGIGVGIAYTLKCDKLTIFFALQLLVLLALTLRGGLGKILLL